MKKNSYSNIPVAQTIVALCEAKGIHHIVISPGSRNAPLIIGFSGNPNMQCYSIVDERCAAFFAIGIAQQLHKPVALVCTSGSAVLNYYPAVAEAFYSDIPLVILSADRPVERIDIGDGQTIRQKNVFENHILYSANLYSEIVPETEIHDLKVKQKQHEAQKNNEREINIALNRALEQNGPVHINVPFYEPLYHTLNNPTVHPKNIPLELTIHPLAEGLQDKMILAWKKAQKKMVLIGVSPPDTISEKWIEYFAQDPSVLVLTETTSNIHHATHINCIDQLISNLTENDFKDLQPDILLTLGGLIVSKRIKAFLRNYQPKLHWHVDPKKAYDTYFCLTEHIKMTPDLFFTGFFPVLDTVNSTYKKRWTQLRDHRRKMHASYLNKITFSDLKAFEKIFEAIPDDQILHLSNSSTVRYAQLFTIKKSLQVFCNRGTSGIDGSTSTAIGAAFISQKPTTIISGDLSFFYDSNALWNAYMPKDFKIIVINNGGGGIFRILPGKEETGSFETFFETVHKLSAIHLCNMFGLRYYKAHDFDTLGKGLQNLFEPQGSPALLEIFTPRKNNDKVLIDYFKHFI